MSMGRCGNCGMLKCVCNDKHFADCVEEKDRYSIIELVAENADTRVYAASMDAANQANQEVIKSLRNLLANAVAEYALEKGTSDLDADWYVRARGYLR